MKIFMAHRIPQCDGERPLNIAKILRSTFFEKKGSEEHWSTAATWSATAVLLELPFGCATAVSWVFVLVFLVFLPMTRVVVSDRFFLPFLYGFLVRKTHF